MALSMLMFKWLVFLVFLSLTTALPDHRIKVSHQTGHDTNSCLSNYSSPCKTLHFVLENGLNSSTLVEITDGIYYLDNIYNIKDKQDISIVGDINDNVVINCNTSVNNESGLSWLKSENITFRSLIFDGCGHLIQTSPLDENTAVVYKYFVGISFTYCRNLTIHNCTFKNSRGVAVVVYDTGGKVDIINSTFINNRAPNISIGLDSDLQHSGGGIFIHFTEFGSLFPFNDTIHEQYTSNTRYDIKNTIFKENHYHKADSHKAIPSPFGWGGGLTIVICGSAKKNIFSIDLCHFEGNEAIWGGGMFAEFHNKAEGNVISLFNNTFIKNKAKYGGGALRTGNDIHEQKNKSLKENQIKLEKIHFYNNEATIGGGLSHYGWTYHRLNGTDDRKITLKQCTFKDNKATMGSAVSVNLNDENKWIPLRTEVPYILEFVNCTIHDNKIHPANNSVLGMGTIYTSRVPIILRGKNTFKNNTNTALLLDNAPLKVFNEVHFINNSGIMGGALAFYGQTKLVLTKNAYLLFKQNKALHKGGAIYIRAPGPEVAPFETTKLHRYQCFIEYDDNGELIDINKISKWKAKLDFVKNTAPLFCGNSVYATTLQSCYLEGENSTENTAFDWPNIINFTGNIEEEISTNPVAIHFKPDDWSNLAPYEKFNASISLLDEKNSTVSGVVSITVKRSPEDDQSPSALVPGSSLFLVQPRKDGKSIVPGLRIKGTQNEDFTLEIATTDGQVVRKSSNIKLGKCLEGFKQHDDRCVCMKETEKYHEGIANCSDDGKTVYLKMGYWGGLVPNGNGSSKEFVTYPCPVNYCYFDQTRNFFAYKKSAICLNDRSADSILCGECKVNYSLSLGNEKCYSDASCSHVFGIEWGLPVFFVVVPIVVLFFLRLNIDIFTSYLGSWLYFYQILPFVVQKSDHFDSWMQGILALTSWQLPGVHMGCFMKGLDNITKLVFNYLFPIYVLVVVVVIAKITKRFGFRCFERTNVLHAISSIIVLCYTNLTLISVKVCHWVPINNNTDVFFVQGSVYSSKHGDSTVPYYYYFLLVFSIFIILFFVLALPIALIFSSFLVRKSKVMSNFKGLFDIFQDCFRDDCRWFSAYYFILRIVFLSLASGISTPGPYRTCWIQMLSVISLVVFVFVKPYKSEKTSGESTTKSNLRWLNIVDTVILTLLCLLVIMAGATQNSEAAKRTRDGYDIIIKVLSWLPMVYLVVLIILAIRDWCLTARRRHGYQDIEEVSSGGTSTT